MQYQIKDLDKSQAELTITVQPDEYKKYLERAAREISQHTTIKGFRPGHATYEQVKQRVGEMKIYEAALEFIVRKFYEEAVKESGLETVGMPKIEVEKLAPDNDVVFKATVALLPEVELPDVSKIKAERKPKEIKDADVDKVLDEIRKMRASEVVKNEPAGKEDKIVVDMDMLLDGVALEGGQTKDHGIYLSEEQYIPGLQKELVGLKKDDEKSFKLAMPKEHYQKQTAGKEVEFKIKVKDVFERQIPELNDEFAKGMGQDSVEKLRGLIQENLTNEAKQKEEQRVEIEMLDQLIDKSKIGEIPELLVEAEKDKMFFELKRGVEQQGMEWNKYIESIKKTEEELIAGFADQAARRAKAALVSRAVAKGQNMNPTKEDIDKEIENIREMYKDNEQAQGNLDRPEVRGSVETLLRNRKVIAWLKECVLRDGNHGNITA